MLKSMCQKDRWNMPLALVILMMIDSPNDELPVFCIRRNDTSSHRPLSGSCSCCAGGAMVLRQCTPAYLVSRVWAQDADVYSWHVQGVERASHHTRTQALLAMQRSLHLSMPMATESTWPLSVQLHRPAL